MAYTFNVIGVKFFFILGIKSFSKSDMTFKKYIAENSLTEHSFCEIHLLLAYYSINKT